jgi:pyruvate,water dikinase
MTDGASSGQEAPAGPAPEQGIDVEIVVPAATSAGRPGRIGDGWRPGDVLLCDKLSEVPYVTLVSSAAVVCTRSGRTSHMAVIARILGIPVVSASTRGLEAISQWPWVVVDGRGTRAYRAEPHHQLAPDSGPRISPSAFRHRPLQLSVVHDKRLFRRISQQLGDEDLQLFLRSEFVWFALDMIPAGRHGDLTSLADEHPFIDALAVAADWLCPRHVLNFRGLDLRSDQVAGADRSIARREPNPSLGLHGTRALLTYEDYLRWELRAVDALHDHGHTNVVYSLPFVTLAAEVEAVLEIRDQVCRNAVPIGVFIETPAAVLETDAILDLGITNVSIGTKDLIQLVVAADRDVPEVRHLVSIRLRPVIATIGAAVAACSARGVTPYVFGFAEDADFIVAEFGAAVGLSLGAGDYFAAGGDQTAG